MNYTSLHLKALLITSALCLLPVNAFAHNKVVVIPLDVADNTQSPFSEPLRPVAPLAPADSNYEISALTVVDKTTELMWERVVDTTDRTWDDAIFYCRSLDIDGLKNWRLPQWQELQSIVDFGQTQPAINGVAFPSTGNHFYWTSDTYIYNPPNAIQISFFRGVTSNSSKTSTFRVRCVR